MTPQPTPQKPISQKQLEANRRNAQRCTGPKTPAGKIRSSRNATRHGLTGHVAVIAEEDREAFNRFSAGLLQSLAPEGDMEIQLAHRIVVDNWRLNRACALEDNLFALGEIQYRDTIDSPDPQIQTALAAARTFQEHGKQFQLLSLYEQRINRTLHKNMELLRELQAGRKAAREKRAIAINELTSRPAPTGFVFSNNQIALPGGRPHHFGAGFRGSPLPLHKKILCSTALAFLKLTP